jgi:hypothetical protein
MRAETARGEQRRVDADLVIVPALDSRLPQRDPAMPMADRSWSALRPSM